MKFDGMKGPLLPTQSKIHDRKTVLEDLSTVTTEEEEDGVVFCGYMVDNIPIAFKFKRTSFNT